MTRRRLRSHLAIATALAVVTVVLPGCTLQGPRPIDDPAVANRPTRPAPTPGLPTVVGLRGDTVVEVEPTTGDVLAEHAVDPGGGLLGLELVPVRRLALVTRTTADGGSELVEVPLDGGSPRVRGDGTVPAVTADGTRVAHVQSQEDAPGHELVAATWDGAVLNRWPIVTTPGDDVTVSALGWEGSGALLVVTLEGAHGSEVRVLPVDRGGTLRGASEVVPAPTVGAVLRAGGFRSPQQLTVAAGCCGTDPARWRVLDVTLHTWGLSEVADGLEAPVRHLDWTADRQHLLVTLDTTPPRVVRWHAGDLVEVADDLVSAQW